MTFRKRVYTEPCWEEYRIWMNSRVHSGNYLLLNARPKQIVMNHGKNHVNYCVRLYLILTLEYILVFCPCKIMQENTGENTKKFEQYLFTIAVRTSSLSEFSLPRYGHIRWETASLISKKSPFCI